MHPAKQAFLSPYSLLDRWLLLDRLEQLSFMDTYRCVDVRSVLFTGFYKVRLLNPEASWEERLRFNWMKYLSSQIQHDYGPAFEEEGNHLGRAFFVERYSWGKTLRAVYDDLQAQGVQPSAPVATLLLYQIAEALQKLQRRHGEQEFLWRLFHGALTPDNVIFSNLGKVSFLDYGASYLWFVANRENSAEVSQTSAIQADIVSLGLLYYELLLGEFSLSSLPFGAQGEALFGVVQRERESLAERIPEDSWRILSSCAQGLYTTTEALLDDLLALCRSAYLYPDEDSLRELLEGLFKPTLYQEIELFQGGGGAQPELALRLNSFAVQHLYDALQADL